jgi:asparagine synthase (glutamine-hydrolysing)
MCGIVGGIGPQAPGRKLIEAQLKSIEHRGPDDSGMYLNNEISLGMCRLAVVEVEDGKQPVSDPRGFIRVVWNGEIYNYKDLRQELLRLGVGFQGNSESEVLINLYLVFGLEFVNKLNGMFAIAIFDSRSNSLHLIRDRLGKKPLWISKLPDKTLLFASEIRALMVARKDLTIRNQMVSEVLQYGYIKGPKSAFNEVEQILPGTILSWSDTTITTQKYWVPSFSHKTKISYSDAVEETKRIIESAVIRRLVSERPIGSFLSGGYDSTIVTAYMAKNMSQKVSTYSIGFEESHFNEAPYAKNVASFLGTNHHEEIVKPDPALLLEKIATVLDQPFADSSIIPSFILAKFASNDLTVALGGDGGDEIFGGYERYLANLTLHRIGVLTNLGAPILNLSGKLLLKERFNSRRISIELLRCRTSEERYKFMMSLVQNQELPLILTREMYDSSKSNAFGNYSEHRELSTLAKMISYDLGSYLPDDLLVKADLSSMANSLELRSPMLDVTVVEWGLSLPDRYKIQGFQTKRVLKDIARSLVPAELVDRPKMGFAIPRATWLRNDMQEMMMDLLTDQTAMNRGWFKSSEVTKLINAHLNGQDNDKALWPMIMLELWARNWHDKRS